MQGRGLKTRSHNLETRRETMLGKLNNKTATGLRTAEAHCDAPCGVYDPASARIAAEAVLSLTKKILDLKYPGNDDPKAAAAFHNTMARYILIKEEQAQLAKE